MREPFAWVMSATATWSMLPFVLTERHRQVLRLTAQGLRASEVAAALWVTESTVKQHLAEVRWRLRAPNTTRAVVIALIQGELSLADLEDDQVTA